MTLYSANVMDVAKPIEKKKGKKVVKEVAPVEEEVPAPPPTPVKKELSEKQLAAIERRKAKKQEAMAARLAEEEEIRQKEAEIQAKEEEIHRKKELQKEKRRLAREAKLKSQEASPPTSDVSVTSQEEVKQPRKRKEREEGEPPAWFQKYIAGVKSEEAKQSTGKIPKKEVLQEAKQAAQEQWNDGLTRDRVQNEVDAHMSRMYGMIFNNRRFK